MKISSILLLCILCCVVTITASIAPDEGMWLLTQIGQLPLDEMQRHGLKLTPQQIYNPDGPSLKDAMVLIPGGTGSFISTTGLIITNHHVALSALQSVSSVGEDYLKDGFHAQSREQEISVPNYTCQVVVSIKDVTREVLDTLSDTMTAEARMAAIRAKSREIEKSTKGTSDFDTQVSETYNGAKYFLYTFQNFKDIRIVYAPPYAIGNYGGEVDNWYWPRHTGDFTIMRAYVAADGRPATYSKDNIPYKPTVYLPISSKGYAKDSFAMLMGFPGRTFRYRTAAEVQLARDETLPLTMELFKKRMDIIEAAGTNNRALQIKYQTVWRRLANSYKNYEGTLQGMRRANILKQRETQERAFEEYLSTSQSAPGGPTTVLEDIRKEYATLKTFNQKQIVYNQIMTGVDVLALANRFKSFAQSHPDGTPKAGEKELAEVKNEITARFKDSDIGVDREILIALLLRASELPSDQQIDAVQELIGSRSGMDKEKYVREVVNELFEDSRLTSASTAEDLLKRSQDDIMDDPLVDFAARFDDDAAVIQSKTTAFNANIARLRAQLLGMTMAWRKNELYPDANRSLRFSYGEVKPYSPRDAVHYDYVTRLGGVIEKETGEEPFIVPPRLKELWEKREYGSYLDSTINDVPVAFLANLDITGGNSGSPVINGNGEFIGIAFDGNWEAVVGDYLYQDDLNRSINVDARYILFLLDKYSGAQNILSELDIR